MSIEHAVEPRGFKRAVRLYEALRDAAVDGEFVGAKTKLYESTGLSMKYYPELWELLTNMGSIQQTQRGTAQQPTKILVLEPPQLENYDAANESVTLTRGATLDTLRARVAAIEERIPPIDLNRFLFSLDTRLKEIEEWIEQHGR